MRILIGLLLITFLVWQVRGFALSCNGGDTQINADVNGDLNCQGNGYTYIVPSSQTLNAEANAEAALNTPENNFNVGLFQQEIANTTLANDPKALPYYAILIEYLSAGLFQKLANLVAGFLQASVLTQNEVNVLDNTLENQQINLDSFNSQVNVAY